MEFDDIDKRVIAITADDEFETLSKFEMAAVLMGVMKIHHENMPEQAMSVMMQVAASLLRNHAEAVAKDVCLVMGLLEQVKSNGR